MNASGTKSRKGTGGPKTSAGKKRSSKNAFVHGLSLPVISDPELNAGVLRLTNLLCQDSAAAGLTHEARRVADAQMDILRVRRAKVECLEQWDLKITGGAESKQPGDGEAKLGSIARELLRLDRYERRAFSRRKFAIRAFAAAMRTR